MEKSNIVQKAKDAVTNPRVLVTGVTGYLGSWVAYRALESGEYTVRGTMRDPSDEKKIKELKEGFGEHFENLELFKAELTDKDSLYKAVEDCDYVLHVASPLPKVSPKDPREVIEPAVNSAQWIFEACDKFDVRRLILTSTTGTLEDFSVGDIEVNEEFKTEKRKYLLPYQISKIEAEDRAFELYESINKKREEEKKERIDFATVHPSFILGPPLIRGGGNTVDFFKQVLEGTLPGIPPYNTRAIDVRDLADAHLRALTATPGRRYVMIERDISFPEVVDIVREEFEPKGYKIPNNQVSTFMLWLGSWFNKEANYFYNAAGVKLHINTDATKKELGIKYREVPDSIRETCYKLLELGIAEKSEQDKK